MDLPLLHALQSIREIEEDLSSFTEDIGIDSTQPTHPNLIYVDQKAINGVHLEQQARDDVFYHLLQDDKNEKRIKTNTLTGAMHIATTLSKIASCWSIILPEGLCIDPSFHILKSKVSDDANMEILGLGDVRILYSFHSEFRQYYLGCGKLTIRNVSFYDRRSNPYRSYTHFAVMQDAQLNLINVKANTPYVGFLCAFEGASVTLDRCALYEPLIALQIEGGGVCMRDCVLVRCGTEIFRTTGVRLGGSLEATRVRYEDCSRFLIQTDSRCVFTDCRFNHGLHRNFAGKFMPQDSPNVKSIGFALFGVTAASTVECEGCKIKGYDGVFRVSNTGSKVALRRCRVSVVDGVGEILENGSAEVVDCRVKSIAYLLKIGFNLKGEMSFFRNTLSSSTKPSFLIDRMSKRPSHDVKGAEFGLAIYDARCLPTEKELSSYTDKFNEARLSRPSDKEAPVFNSRLMKQCGYCYEPEGQEAVSSRSSDEPIKSPRKFQFCEKCRQVCYCSKVCQTKDWPDHKLSCSRQAVLKQAA